MKNLQKGFAIPLIIAIVAVLIVGGGIYYAKNKSETSTNTPVTNNSSIPNQSESGDMANWKTYRNDKYGFEFMYPTDIFQEPKEILGTDIPGTPNFLQEIRFCLKGADKEIIMNELCYKKAQGDTFYGPLSVRFDRNGEYTTYAYRLGLYQNSSQYKKIQIDGRDAYIPSNPVRNDIELLKLSGPYFISSFDLNKYRDTCAESPVECGILEIDDAATRNLFNQIISTIKFY